MKALTFKEVIAVIKEGDKYESVSDGFILQSITQTDYNLVLRNSKDILEGSGFYVCAGVQKFTKVQKPITFMEALEQNVKIRIEHELVSRMLKGGINIDEGEIEDNFMGMLTNYCIFPGEILGVLSWKLTSKDIAEVIQNAKCYVERED